MVLFVSVYSIPNVFLLMAVFGGVILDKLGIRRTGFIFVGMMTIGALITAYGASNYYTNGGFGYEFMGSFLTNFSPELKMMLFGRFLFGLGAETSIVVISKIIVKWFKGKELALAFGVKIGLARLGSAAAFSFSPVLIEAATGWTTAIWFAAFFVCAGMLAFVVYMLFDLKLDKQIKQEKLLNKDEEFRFSDLLMLFKNRSFIYITLLCLTFYSAVFPFQSFAPDFFLNKFNFSLEKSGQIASLLSFRYDIFLRPYLDFLLIKKAERLL